MKKLIAICYLVIGVCCLLILIFWDLHSSDLGTQNQGVSAPEITNIEITEHPTTTDCWTSIGGSVYNLTNYFTKHPNENLASQLCGKAETMNANLPKALTPESLLSYRIGILTPN